MVVFLLSFPKTQSKGTLQQKGQTHMAFLPLLLNQGNEPNMGAKKKALGAKQPMVDLKTGAPFPVFPWGASLVSFQ